MMEDGTAKKVASSGPGHAGSIINGFDR